MKPSRRHTEAALRATERRKREDDAPRLKEEVPHLEKLKLEIEEHRGDGAISGTRYTRHIVVDHAPALFEIPCGESDCEDGGHDLTPEIMRALRSSSREFSGDDACNGRLGSGYCRRVLVYQAIAEYRD